MTAGVNLKLQSLAIILTKSALLAREKPRLPVLRVFLEPTLQDLNEHVQSCTIKLVFNLKEVGISDWETARGEKLWDR
jgi:hypothetical protein